jgi:hypothetical protein
MRDFHRVEHGHQVGSACCFREVTQYAIAGGNCLLVAIIKAESMLWMEDSVKECWSQQSRFLDMPEVAISHIMEFTNRRAISIKIDPVYCNGI